MNIKLLNSIVLLGIAIFLCQGCTKEKYPDTPLSGNWLLPLLKGKISPTSLSSLNNKEFDFFISADDIGMTTGSDLSSPIPITIRNIDSFPIETTDLVQEMTVDTGLGELIITNRFPVKILAGTIISLKTIGSTVPVATVELAEDLLPEISKEFNLDISGSHINHLLYLDVEQLIIDSFTNKQFDGSDILFQLIFKKMTIKEMWLGAQKHYELRDTVDFNSSLIEYDENDDKVTDSTINAKIFFKATNNLPINADFQIYFLDYSGQVIYSLFTPSISAPAADYIAGELSSPAIIQQDYRIPKSRLDIIKNAVQVIYSLSLNTNHHHGAPLRISKEQTLDLKATGDIHLLFSPSFIFN